MLVGSEYYSTKCLPQNIKPLQILAMVRIQLRAYMHLLTYYLCHVKCKSLKGSDLRPQFHTIGITVDFHDRKQNKTSLGALKVHYFIVFQTN